MRLVCETRLAIKSTDVCGGISVFTMGAGQAIHCVTLGGNVKVKLPSDDAAGQLRFVSQW